MWRKVVPVFVLSVCLIGSGAAMAAEATDQLRGSIDRIIDHLADPAMQKPEKKTERRNLIYKIVDERFDYPEMARRSLGEYWTQLTPDQQRAFTAAFSSLLQNTYITKIEKYTNEKVNYSPERPKGEAVSIRTEVSGGGTSIPVEYSLRKSDGKWVVYDVNVEGVSLVTNYRSQFTEIMRKEGFNGLMNKLNEKLRAIG